MAENQATAAVESPPEAAAAASESASATVDIPSLSAILPTLTGEDAEYVKGCIKSGIDTIPGLVARGRGLYKEFQTRTAVPKEDASQEEWSGFLKKLNPPPDPTGYASPADAAEDVKRYLDGMKNAAHAAGMPARMWKDFSSKVTDLYKATTAEERKRAEDAMNEFRAKAAEKFGAKTEERIAAAQRRMTEFLTPEEVARAKDDPRMVNAFLQVDEVLSDDKLPGHRPSLAANPITNDPYAAGSRMEEIGAMKDWESNPELLKEWNSLSRVVQAAGFRSAAHAIHAGRGGKPR